MSAQQFTLEQLLESLAVLEMLPESQRRVAAEAAAKLRGDALCVAVVGEFKRGKSTLVNALIEDSLLPTGVTPVTAVSTLLQGGVQRSAVVRGEDGSVTPIDIANLAAYITEQGNPHNHRRVREVVISHPSPLLRRGLTIADTPGLGSVHAHNTASAESFLPRVDVALLVLSVDAPLSHAEEELLAHLQGSAARTAVCLNKADLVAPGEVDEMMSFISWHMARPASGCDVPIFAVSARRACSGGSGNGLGKVRHWLEDEVRARRSALLAERGRRVAMTLLNAAEAALRLEEAAAEQPRAALAGAIRAFDQARDGLRSDADLARSLLLTTGAETAAAIIDAQAEALRRDLPAELQSKADDEWEPTLREASRLWARQTEAQLVQALTPQLRRHAGRLQEHADAFVRRAGGAFGATLPVPTPMDPSLELPHVSVRVTEAPGALAMGVRGVRHRLPGRAGERWRRRAREARAAEDADRLAGRLHHAASVAVTDALRDWADDVGSRWQLVSGALEEAVARARAGADGATTSVQRLRALRGSLDDLRRSLPRE
ncbi:MAG: dynamin family protein [Candidatus Dormibacteria bacterium]